MWGRGSIIAGIPCPFWLICHRIISETVCDEMAVAFDRIIDSDRCQTDFFRADSMPPMSMFFSRVS